MSKGLIERAADLLRERKDKTKKRLDEIMKSGETKDDASKRPQGEDKRDKR